MPRSCGLCISNDKKILIFKKKSSLKNNKNSFTKEIHSFDKELEDFLGIPKCADKHRKPIEVLWNYKNGKIEESKLTALKEIILKLIR